MLIIRRHVAAALLFAVSVRALIFARLFDSSGYLRSRSFLKIFLSQAISLLLIISLLTVSTPAMPPAAGLLAAIGESGQDIRYSFLSKIELPHVTLASLADSATVEAALINPLLGLVVGTIFKKRQQRISRIEITPRGAIIREGERVALNAVALDGDGVPIQGVRFDWTAAPRSGKGEPQSLPEGLFTPQSPDDFFVTAEAGGAQARVGIRVKRDDVMAAMKDVSAQISAASDENAAANQSAVTARPNPVDKRQPLPPPLFVSSRDQQPLSREAILKSMPRLTAPLQQAQQQAMRGQLPEQNQIVALEVACTPDNPYYPDCGYRDAGSNQVVESMAQAGAPMPNRPPVECDIDCAPSCPGYPFCDGGGGPTPTPTRTPTPTPPPPTPTPNGPPNNSSPRGNLDGVNGTDRSIWGWSFDPDNPSASNAVHIYINGPAGSGTGYAITADQPRADVNNAFGIGGNHGFTFQIPAQFHDGQVHSVYAYGIDTGTNPPTLLDSSPMYFNFLPTATPTPTPPPNPGGGCSQAPYNAQYSWNSANYYTADDAGEQPGAPPNNGTDGAGSGNFSFAAPVIALAGRGDLGVNLSLNYNSLVWHQANGQITYDIDKGSPAPGWSIGMGKLMDMGTGGAMLESPDGTRHSYEGVMQSYYAPGYSEWRGRTTDGSFVDYVVSRSPAGVTSASANYPNGTLIYYGATSDGVSYPTQIKDRQGNYMNISYCNNVGPKINQITDALGRVIQFNYDGASRLISVTGPGQNNTVRTFIRLHYRQLALGYAFNGLTAMVRNGAPDVIDAIYYPDTNNGYWFGDADSYSSYGMIAKVSEQRGMGWAGAAGDQGTVTAGQMSRQMTYNYPLTPNGSLTGAPQYTSMTEDWANRDTTPAVTTYSVNNNANPRTTSVTLPNGNTIRQTSFNTPGGWNDGLLYQTENISPQSQVLSRSYTSWGLGDYNAPRPVEVQSVDERNQITKQAFTYDTVLNQVATVKDYGYSNNLLRTKVVTYENGADYRGSYNAANGYWNSGRHIFSLVKTEELYDAGGGRVSRRDYSYDQANLADTPGVVMFDEKYNPYTTQMYNTGVCLNWVTPPYGSQYCTQWQIIPVYDAATAKRGNVTNTTVYADAANLSGAIAYDSTYDRTGNVRTTTTDCCQQMSFNYTTNTQYSQPESHTKGSSDPNSPDRMTETAAYDFNTGHTNTATDFNGRTTTYYYDAVNRPAQTISPTGEHQNQWYDDNNLITIQAIYDANNVRQGYTATWVNGRGQQVQTQQLTANPPNDQNPANSILTNTKYDQMGRKLQETMPYTPTVTSQQWTTYQYDALSRVVQVTAPDGSTSKSFYNETQRPAAATANLGQTVRSQDAWGRERWARTDDWGRTAEVVEPDPNGSGAVFEAGSLQTVYSYDAKDQLTNVNQGGQTRWFAYDSLGRLTRQKLAEQSGTINDGGQFVGANTGQSRWSDAFAYDNRSNLIQRVDARGVKTNFNYNNDPLNRLQSVVYDKTGADTTNPINDAAAVTLSYLATGDKTRVSKVTTASAIEENVYDIEGRIAEYRMTYAISAGNPMVTSYLYDSLSRLTEVRYPASYGMAGNPRKVVTPGYDETSRLKELKVDNQIQMSEIVYNPLSQVTQLKTGAATGNADLEQYAYDQPTGLLTNQKVVKANTNTPLLDQSYEYNRGLSNGTTNGKTGQLTHIANNLDHNKDRVYEFDTLGRLRTAKGGAATGVGGVTANWTQTYQYDRYGNRTNVTPAGVAANSQAVPSDGLASLAYDQPSNHINTPGYQYDLAGNLTRGQDAAGAWQKYEYDVAGRLYIVRDDGGNQLFANFYGTGRQRLASLNYNGSDYTFYVWGGSSVLAEYAVNAANFAAVSWRKIYIYAGSRLLSTFTNNGSGGETLEYQHPDRTGTKLITNNTANTSFEQSTLPFGTSLDAETSGTTNQRFTTYDRSAITNLDYAVNRSYSSAQGRFTSVDPIGMSATNIGNPQSMNLYAYVGNNPIDNVDPSGLFIQGIKPPPDLSGFYQFLRDSYEFNHPRQEPIVDYGGGGGGGVDTPSEKKCDPKSSGELSPAGIKLLASHGITDKVWDGLEPGQKLCFWNIVASMEVAGLSLGGWNVDFSSGHGITNERVYFASSVSNYNSLYAETLTRLVNNTNTKADPTKFIRNSGKEHTGVKESYRQWVPEASVQLGFSKDQVNPFIEIDIDEHSFDFPGSGGSHALDYGKHKIGGWFGGSGQTNPRGVVANTKYWECKPSK